VTDCAALGLCPRALDVVPVRDRESGR
jgi:hypothetical protein